MLYFGSLSIRNVLFFMENVVKHIAIGKQYLLQTDIYTTKENTLVVSFTGYSYLFVL